MPRLILCKSMLQGSSGCKELYSELWEIVLSYLDLYRIYRRAVEREYRSGVTCHRYSFRDRLLCSRLRIHGKSLEYRDTYKKIAHPSISYHQTDDTLNLNTFSGPWYYRNIYVRRMTFELLYSEKPGRPVIVTYYPRGGISRFQGAINEIKDINTPLGREVIKNYGLEPFLSIFMRPEGFEASACVPERWKTVINDEIQGLIASARAVTAARQQGEIDPPPVFDQSTRIAGEILYSTFEEQFRDRAMITGFNAFAGAINREMTGRQAFANLGLTNMLRSRRRNLPE